MMLYYAKTDDIFLKPRKFIPRKARIKGGKSKDRTLERLTKSIIKPID